MAWMWVLLLATCDVYKPDRLLDDPDNDWHDIRWQVNPALLPPEPVFFASYSSPWNEHLKREARKRAREHGRSHEKPDY